MASRFWVCLILGVLGVVPCAAGETVDRQWIVALKITDPSPDDDSRRVLAEPTIACTDTFDFLAGGDVAKDGSDKELEIGTRVAGTLKTLKTDRLQLSLSVRLASLAHQQDDAESRVVVADTIEVRTRLRPGETRQFNCGGGRICEVRIESANETKKSQATASKHHRGYVEVEASKR